MRRWWGPVRRERRLNRDRSVRLGTWGKGGNVRSKRLFKFWGGFLLLIYHLALLIPTPSLSAPSNVLDDTAKTPQGHPPMITQLIPLLPGDLCRGHRDKWSNHAVGSDAWIHASRRVLDIRHFRASVVDETDVYVAGRLAERVSELTEDSTAER